MLATVSFHLNCMMNLLYHIVYRILIQVISDGSTFEDQPLRVQQTTLYSFNILQNCTVHLSSLSI